MPRPREIDRTAAQALLSAGVSVAAIAREFHVSTAAIYRLISLGELVRPEVQEPRVRAT